jgi:hypothetical protein
MGDAGRISDVAVISERAIKRNALGLFCVGAILTPAPPVPRIRLGMESP